MYFPFNIFVKGLTKKFPPPPLHPFLNSEIDPFKMLFIKCLFSKFSGTYVQQEDYNDDRWSTFAQQLRFKEAYIDKIDLLVLYNTFLVQ